MAERPRDRAICLYATDFSETSQVVHLLTREHGVVHLLAKGSKRARSATGGRIDLLSTGEVVFIPSRGTTLGTLTEFTEAANHSPLRKRLAALNGALYMLEITRMLLAEGDPHPPVYDLLAAALDRLDRPDAPTAAVLAYFQWRLLLHVGLLGEMGRCLNCGRPLDRRGTYFTSREGGMLCRDCEGGWTEKRQVGGEALAGIAAMTAMQRRQPASLTEPQALAVLDLLTYHLSYQLGRSPRMFRYVHPAGRH
ncbi:MAG: DNA repair protein RecO [Planctomycetes bacterium]|nr:DNA repair protein RecO [Planctomycetota bacterium]